MESIQESVEKIKGKRRFFALFLIVFLAFVLVAGISFILGRLSLKTERARHDAVHIEYPPLISAYKVSERHREDSSQRYVASISGTKYYALDCSGVSRIKEENKTYFDSEIDAENAGYDPASNCF